MYSQLSAVSVARNNGKARRSLWLGAIILSLVATARAQAPAVNAGGIVNAASGSTQGVAPGSIVSIYGTNLASAPVPATKTPLTTTLGDVTSVTFNGVSAPLFYVSALQINAQVPWDVLPSGTTSGTVGVVVTRSTGASPAQNVQIVATLPGIFTVSQNGVGQAIATDNADGALSAPGPVTGYPQAHDIGIGDYLIVWCTGMGAVNPAIASGAPASSTTFSNTVATPVVTIGGVQAKFVYSVLSPQYVGLNQIGVQVAEGTPTGNAEALQIQVNGVTTSSQVTVAVGASSTSAFNTLKPAIAVFDPTASLSGIPTVTFSDGTTLPSVGYQQGNLVNGKVIYYPWQVQPGGGGSNTLTDITAGMEQGVVMSYNASTTGFTDATNWAFFDMSTLDANAKGFNSGIVVGNNVYMVPNGDHGADLPTFVVYDATKAINDTTAYQFMDAPARSTTLGPTYGWCQGVFDGTYVYYAPNIDAGTNPNATGGTFSGNVVRYNTTAAFNSGGSWSSFDMTTVNASAAAFQSAIYDGHRFVYFVPFRNKLMVRYDTQYGTPGTANPAGFTNPAAYTVLDTTKLGSAGLPQVSGTGNAANLTGFTGAAVVWDAAHQNEYLYMVPWAIYVSVTPTVQSTAGRVRIGVQSGSTWSDVDITSTASSSPSLTAATPNWELFDLNTLTTNPQWAANGWPVPATYASGTLAGQSMIGGFQGNWINTASASPRVGFGADFSQFWVEHDVSHALNDPTGWYVGQVPPQHRNGTFGGAYDAEHQIFYPSPPSAPLIQATGL